MTLILNSLKKYEIMLYLPVFVLIFTPGFRSDLFVDVVHVFFIRNLDQHLVLKVS